VGSARVARLRPREARRAGSTSRAPADHRQLVARAHRSPRTESFRPARSREETRAPRSPPHRTIARAPDDHDDQLERNAPAPIYPPPTERKVLTLGGILPISPTYPPPTERKVLTLGGIVYPPTTWTRICASQRIWLGRISPPFLPPPPAGSPSRQGSPRIRDTLGWLPQVCPPEPAIGDSSSAWAQPQPRWRPQRPRRRCRPPPGAGRGSPRSSVEPAQSPIILPVPGPWSCGPVPSLPGMAVVLSRVSIDGDGDGDGGCRWRRGWREVAFPPRVQTPHRVPSHRRR
jgi:hypothetical protein